jgi:hypothetical protein
MSSEKPKVEDEEMFPAAVAELLQHLSTDRRVEGSDPAVLQLLQLLLL